MNRPRVSPVAIFVPLLAAAAAWAVYTIGEVCEEEIPGQWSLRALINPYLAAEKFLEQSEIDVVELEGFARLESLDGVSTLFIGDANQVVVPKQLDRVIAWMERGGNVIYSANSVNHADDLLLEKFNIEVETYGEEDEGDFDFDDDDESDEKSLGDNLREYNRQIKEGKSREEIVDSFDQENVLTTVDFADGAGELEVAFYNQRLLLHPYIEGGDNYDSGLRPRSWAYSEYGVHLIQFALGDGMLTVISDPEIWTSYRIDSHDHAFLLWRLSASGGDFAILRPVLQDSLWQLTLKNASELLIAVSLLIAMWIWYLAYRFGRLVPRDSTRTRALAEHFSSVSHYLWHRRHGEYLIQPLRQRVLRRASLTLGEFARANPERQFELLAQRSDRTVTSVTRAMSDSEFNETSFVQTVKLLKHIEQSL